jgi:alpha-1,2-rhamnosyltransferase
MGAPRRIYIECTATYYSGLNTGIQRVVNNVIARADDLSQKFGVEIVPIVAVLGTFKKLQDVIELSNQQSVLGAGRKGLSALKLRISKFFWRASTSSSPIVAFFAQMVHAGLRFAYSIPRKLFRTFNPTRLLPGRHNHNSDFFSSDDLFLMLDSFWIYGALDLAEKPMTSRPVILSVIYDLIPITHPQYCDKEFVKVFELLFPRIVALSDGLIGISQTVQHSIADYVVRNSPEWAQKGMLDYFYLGADFKVNTLRQTDQLSPDISELLDSGVPFFLAVGTVEPRKGYGYLMDGFEILWRQGAVYPLVIVGKVGWLCTDILKKAEGLKKLGRPILMLHDVDDYTLDLLYRKSAAVIFPSFVEGFGLPLVEALVRGKQVLASNIEVFKEVGGTAASYFEPGCAKSLAQRVGEFFDQSSAKQEPAETKVVHGAINWDESAHSLIEKSIKMYTSKYHEH